MTDILIIIGLVALIIAICLIRSKQECEIKVSETERLIPVVVPEKWCMYDQLHKIQKEHDEALLELDVLEDSCDDDVRLATYESKQSLAEELVDVQVACETALNMLGLNREQRDQVRQRVNQKNYLRGYHGN